MAPRILPLSHVLTKMLNLKPAKYALSATIFMNGSGQMRRSSAECYWLLCMGNEICEYEVRHLIFQPKNMFAGGNSSEYVPKELEDPPDTSHSLFGNDTDEDEPVQEEPAQEEPAAIQGQLEKRKHARDLTCQQQVTPSS